MIDWPDNIDWESLDKYLKEQKEKEERKEEW